SPGCGWLPPTPGAASCCARSFCRVHAPANSISASGTIVPARDAFMMCLRTATTVGLSRALVGSQRKLGRRDRFLDEKCLAMETKARLRRRTLFGGEHALDERIDRRGARARLVCLRLERGAALGIALGARGDAPEQCALGDGSAVWTLRR